MKRRVRVDKTQSVKSTVSSQHLFVLVGRRDSEQKWDVGMGVILHTRVVEEVIGGHGDEAARPMLGTGKESMRVKTRLAMAGMVVGPGGFAPLFTGSGESVGRLKDHLVSTGK